MALLMIIISRAFMASLFGSSKAKQLDAVLSEPSLTRLLCPTSILALSGGILRSPYMKSKNTSNIIFIVSMLIYTGIAIEVIVVRNFLALGVASGLIVAALYSLSIACLIIAACIENKLWATLCRLVVIGWLAFVFITSFSSVNEDATIMAIILIIVAVSAMVFGVFRRKGQGKNS